MVATSKYFLKFSPLFIGEDFPPIFDGAHIFAHGVGG